MSTTTRDDFIRAIYGQESSHGKADTSKPNYAGARGPMQVMPQTFDGLKKQGVIPQDWSLSNQDQAKQAGERLAGMLFDKFGGDPRKAAAAYYAGEKAVKADGTIVNFRDLKNPKAPTTLQYADDIVARLGGDATGAVSAPAQAVQPADSDTLWNSGEFVTPKAPRAGDPAASMTPLEKEVVLRAGVASGADVMPDARVLAPAAVAARAQQIEPLPLGDSQSGLTEAAGATEKRAKFEEGTSTLDVSRAAFLNSPGGAMLRRIVRPEYTPDGSKPDEETVRSIANEEDRWDYLSAYSEPMRQRVLWEQRERDEREKTLGTMAGVGGFAAQMLGGVADPLGWVGGYGVARTLAMKGVGSTALAAAGRGGAAASAGVAENVAVEAGLEITRQAMEGRYSVSDLFAQAAMGGVFAAPFAYFDLNTAARATAFKSAQAQIVKQAEAEIALHDRAAKALGPEAAPEAIRAEMDRIQIEESKAVIVNNTTAAPRDRQLLPEDEALRDDSEPMLEVVEAGQKSTAEADDSMRWKDDPKTQAAMSSMETELGRKLTPEERVMAIRYRTEEPMWNTLTAQHDLQISEAARTGGIARQISEVEGLRFNWLERQKEGTHQLPAFAKLERYKVVADAVEDLRKQFIPDAKLAIGIHKNKDGSNASFDAIVNSIGKHHVIGLRDNLSPHQALVSAVHEVGHTVFHQRARDIPPLLLKRMVEEHSVFLKEFRSGKASARFKRFNEGSAAAITRDMENPRPLNAITGNREYTANFDEYTAEAFTRFIQRRARTGGVTLPQKALDLFAQAWERIKDLYQKAFVKGYLPKDEAFDEFFERVMNNTLKVADKQGKALNVMPAEAYLRAAKSDTSGDDLAVQTGIDLLPEDSPTARAEKKAILHLHKRAAEWERAHPMDDAWNERVKNLADNSVFSVASTGLVMLKSKNPVVRMVAFELLEDASGVSGTRHSTAAISKHIHERMFMGNAVNDLQKFYGVWGAQRGGTFKDDALAGNMWAKFNKEVAAEIEARAAGATPRSGVVDQQVVNAANMLEAAYGRLRSAQVQNKTLGWAALPASSVGYMPHRMSSARVLNMSNGERAVLHSALVDQFINIEGWDISFAANLAGKYIDRVKQRAAGGFDAPMNMHQTGAADVVEEALTGLGLSREEVRARVGQLTRGAAAHTKGRIKLDLNAVHNVDGKDFRLLDLFETDQLKLLRAQSQRVSGEVALARFGIYGKPHLALVRRAMMFGKDSQMPEPRELEMFDQVSAEFLGEPFGNEGGKWLERARTLNSVARLGGIVFNQFAEFINSVVHVGVARTLSSVGNLPRLHREVRALARGERVDNPLLGSIEEFSGAQFGTDAYKLVFPFDHPDHAYATYGRDGVTGLDRLLRGASHVQSKISLWRAMHASQERGVAEQILAKAAHFARSGKDDAALQQMGLSNSIAHLRQSTDFDEVFMFDGDKLIGVDVTKIRDQKIAEEFIHAVHRGVKQIIQGTFIGEQGKWAHDGLMKTMLQFRTFSVTSMEKQWARQRNSRGTAAALGILLGSMSVAAPIYMARVYVSSIGRDDQEEYLDRRLSATAIARATLNYVAMSGLAGDFLDALSAAAPDSVQAVIGSPTGGRTGTTQTAIGNLIAPSAGYIDDVYGAIQNLDSVEKVSRVLPFSRLPYMVPALNALGD